jgi:hypothetical protein
MILGLYYFITCIVVGQKITSLGFGSLESIDKDSCCESRLLIPEWLFKYIALMIRSGNQRKLGIFMIVGLFFYSLLVLVASWLFGLVLFRSIDKPGQVFGYGFSLYLIIEFTIGIALMVYWFIQSFIVSMKKMQDYEISFDAKMADGFDDEDSGNTDKITKMADKIQIDTQHSIL